MGGGSQNPIRSNDASTSRPSRAVVLAPPHGSTPAVLLGALGRKGFSCFVVSDAPAVMAELASQPALAVVVCEPHRQRDVRELAKALAVYFPDTLRWGYQSRSDGPSLQSLEACWSAKPHPKRGEGRPAAESSLAPRAAANGTQSNRAEPERAEANRAEANRAEHDEAMPEPQPGGSFDSLASVVERATEDAGGPRLRLIGGDEEAGPWHAGCDPAVPPPRVASQSSRIRAAGLRRRLSDLVHSTNPAGSLGDSVAQRGPRTPKDRTPSAPADADAEPLISHEELAMLLGPPDAESGIEPEPESDPPPGPRAASGGSPPPRGPASQ